MKWFRQRNKCEGNKWMKLGSVIAKVLNPHDFPAGSEVKMTRGTYKIQPDGSIRRTDKRLKCSYEGRHLAGDYCPEHTLDGKVKSDVN